MLKEKYLQTINELNETLQQKEKRISWSNISAKNRWIKIWIDNRWNDLKI